MSLYDEDHTCWSECCDLGPHACICGNDCQPDEETPVEIRTRTQLVDAAYSALTVTGPWGLSEAEVRLVLEKLIDLSPGSQAEQPWEYSYRIPGHSGPLIGHSLREAAEDALERAHRNGYPNAFLVRRHPASAWEEVTS